MKRNNRFLALGLTAAVAATSLAGCGGGNGGSGSGDPNAPLTVAIWDGGQQAGLQQILDAFTESTGIKTQLQVIEWNSYWTLLEAGASGGDMPDVFWMHSNEAVKYMSNNILLDITDKVAASEVPGGFKGHVPVGGQDLRSAKGYGHHRDLVQQDIV